MLLVHCLAILEVVGIATNVPVKKHEKNRAGMGLLTIWWGHQSDNPVVFFHTPLMGVRGMELKIDRWEIPNSQVELELRLI